MRYGLLFLILLSCVPALAQNIDIVSGGRSSYSIATSAQAGRAESEAALWLQKVVLQASGVRLPLVKSGENPAGSTILLKLEKNGTTNGGWHTELKGSNVIVAAYNNHDLRTAVCYLAEQLTGARKWDARPADFAKKDRLSLPAAFARTQIPAFVYREAYYPYSRDEEYRCWNGLQQFETLWGLWGHSYDKLVPARTYFREHPEYYALVDGKRQPSQLCLGNEQVFNIVVAGLRQRMADNPDAEYWSVSPNDDLGYCTCDRCRTIDEREGGPQGSLVHFLNRIAAVFPDKKFTTLAYTYTSHPTRSLRPAPNVYIMLSTIDAYRHRPLAEEPTAAGFVRDLKGWGRMTEHIFIWDYNTQFTNYLAPFPNLHTMAANLRFFRQQGVKGVFVQGSGDTYGEMAELRSWVTAQLLQNPDLDEDSLIHVFLGAYYGNAAPSVGKYLSLIDRDRRESGRPLDIYGNPVNEWNTWLKPEQIDACSKALDQAEAAVEGKALLSERVARARLPLEYVVIQQTKVYGREKNGLYEPAPGGGFRVKSALLPRIGRFVVACKKAGVTEMWEGGPAPDAYLRDWEALLKQPVPATIAWKAPVKLLQNFAPEYPARGAATLTDGTPGFSDFSYNWLCFYGVPMEAIVDLGKKMPLNTVLLHFLDDPRHWIFLPRQVELWGSEDGTHYTRLGTKSWGVPDEHYELSIVPAEIRVAAGSACRYLKVVAAAQNGLPGWRSRPGKKPMLACDEIWVQ